MYLFRFLYLLLVVLAISSTCLANDTESIDNSEETNTQRDSVIAQGEKVEVSAQDLHTLLAEVQNCLQTSKSDLKSLVSNIQSVKKDSVLNSIIKKSDSIGLFSRVQVDSIYKLQSKLHTVIAGSKELYTQYITQHNDKAEEVSIVNEHHEKAEEVLILSTKESAARLHELVEIENLKTANITICDSIKSARSGFEKTLIDSIKKLTLIIDEEKDKLPIATISLRNSEVPTYKLDTLPCNSVKGCKDMTKDSKLFKRIQCRRTCRKTHPKVAIVPDSGTVSIESVKLLLHNGIVQEVVVYCKGDKQKSIEYENTRSYSISTIDAFKQFRTGVRKSRGSKEWKTHYYYLEYESPKAGKKKRSFIFIPDVLNLKRNSNLYSRTYVPENCTLSLKSQGEPQTIHSKSLITSLDLRTYTDFFGLAEGAKNNLVNVELAASFIGSTKPYRENGNVLWLKEFSPYFKYHLLKDENRLSFNSWDVTTLKVTETDINGDSIGVKDSSVFIPKDSFSVYQIDALNNRSIDIGFQMTLFHRSMKIHTFDITAKTGVMMGTFNIVDTVTTPIKGNRLRTTPEVMVYDTTEHTLYNPYFHIGANWHFNATELLSFDLGGGVYPFIGVFEPHDWNGIDISSKIDDEIFRPFDLLWQINFKSKNSADYFFRAKYLMQLRSKHENADHHQDALGRLNLELGVSTTINQLLELITK